MSIINRPKGMYLTCFIPKLIRFPITFKSVCNGQTFYHIVLGIYYEGQLGSIGLSRRDDLADKPLIYDSLAGLIREFQRCYAGYSHKLQKVTIGGPVPTDLTSQIQVQWNRKKFTLNSKCDWNSMSRLPRTFKRDQVGANFFLDFNSELGVNEQCNFRTA